MMEKTPKYHTELKKYLVSNSVNSKFTKPHISGRPKDTYSYRSDQKLNDIDPGFRSQRRTQPIRTSGGDAEHMFFESCELKDPEYQLEPPNQCKLQSSEARVKREKKALHNFVTDLPMPNYKFDVDTKPTGPRSIGSDKSRRSTQTVISRKNSSRELRETVKTQCKFRDTMNKTLAEIYKSENDEEPPKERPRVRKTRSKPAPVDIPTSTSSCKRCDKLTPRRSNQKPSLDTTRDDVNDLPTGNELFTLSADDVVNSKVINPMIRKLQRMYLNNLKEEMSLMEDLERLPHKVNAVYKATKNSDQWKKSN